MLYYQDANLYYFRKPAGIPSTFGREKSFLDILLIENSLIVQSLSTFFWTDKKIWINGRFGELWLLNRLDNDTSWLLYFAKNPRVYHEFRQMQSELLLEKYYLAQVYGDVISTIWKDKKEYQISTPLAHHRYNADRMVAILSPQDLKKTKWSIHHLTTTIIDTEFLSQLNTSILLIKIQKGLRHQIRAHLASIGHPICGDKIYVKSSKQDYDNLQLFSIWLESH